MEQLGGVRVGGLRVVGVTVLLVAALLPTVLGLADAATDPIHYQNTPIASWRADGVGWATLIVGNTVYVGGDFPTVRNQAGTTVVTRANLAAFDVTTGELISTFTANTNGIVRALATDGTRLFVGGFFTTVNGAARSRIAAVDLATGAVDPGWNANANNTVYALTAAGGRVYLGGAFTSVSSQTRNRIAALDATTGALQTYAPNLNNTVAALTSSPDGSAIYIGGQFTTVNGSSRPYLVRTDANGTPSGTNWSPLTAPLMALSLNEDGTRLGAGVAGTVNHGALYNTATGARIWSQMCDGDAQAVKIVDGSMFTGFHESCGGDTTIRLVSNAVATGARDTTARPTFDQFWGIRGLDGNGQNLVAVGEFTRVSGVTARGFVIFPFRYVPPPPVSLGSTATWRYLVTPSAAPATWATPGFDASAWPAGPAQLGFGDGDEATTIGFGGNANAKYSTTYFRTTFEAAAVPQTLTLDLVADDGAVVYVNGVEVARDNLPAGGVTYATRASSGRSGTAENAVRTFSIPPSSVVPGTNTIAVEVHQDAPTSSDLSFSAALTSTANPNATTTTSTSSTTTTTDPNATTTTLDTTTTTLDPTTTTTSTTTSTTSTTTTTTLPTGSTLFTDSFTGADGSAWPSAWTADAGNGSALVQGGAGRLTFNNVTGAYARAFLSGVPARADSSLLFSYQWGSTGAVGYFSVYLRGSGGWNNSYRPRSAYGLELASNSTSVTVKRTANASTTNLRTVTDANVVSTAKQWIRLRVVGSTIQFRSWLDGQAEPSTWRSTDTDTTVTAPGQAWFSYNRGGSNTAVRYVAIDDVVLTDGS